MMGRIFRCPPREVYRIVPGYDLLSTLVYGNWHSDKMAMKIGSKYKFKAVRPKHVLQFAQQIGISEKLMKREILFFDSKKNT